MRLRRLTAALDALLDRRTDAGTPAIARVIVGVASLAGAVEAAHLLSHLLAPAVLRLPYTPGLPDPPPAAVPALIAAWSAAAVAFTLGWRTHAAGAVLAATMGYALLLDQQSYSNHQYLLVVVVVLLTLADCGAAASVDAWRGRGRPVVPAWPVLLLKLQLTVVYGFTALAKLNLVYLSGALLAGGLRTGGWLPVPTSWQIVEVMSPLAVASVLIEVVLAAALWLPRWRRPAAALGVAFHATMIWTMSVPFSLAIFAAGMLALYALFFDASDARRWWSRRPAMAPRPPVGRPS
jgi:hypothetical protein